MRYRVMSMVAAGVLVLAACQAGQFLLPGGIVVGTWGAQGAGLIATDSTAHVHIGCEFGYADGPIHLHADGSFDTTGTFTVGAYPIGPGVTHPARYVGQVGGKTMELRVVLTDTVKTYGPVWVTYGVQPQMGPCPICAGTKAMQRPHERLKMR